MPSKRSPKQSKVSKLLKNKKNQPGDTSKSIKKPQIPQDIHYEIDIEDKQPLVAQT
jgi:hypothetical protein